MIFHSKLEKISFKSLIVFFTNIRIIRHSICRTLAVQWGIKEVNKMVEALLQEILHEVKGTRSDVRVLDDRIGRLEKRMSHVEDRLNAVEERMSAVEERLTAVEDRVSTVEERLSALEEDMTSVKERLTNVENSIVVLDKKINETKTISEAVRHSQEVLTAKYDSLSLDVHELKGKVTHLTNVLEDKVLPLLHDHESGIQVLNNRVFKVESALQRLVSP
jgi:chromosome segregation ATPase